MEYINKIELAGKVGRVSKTLVKGESLDNYEVICVKFPVCVCKTYEGKDGHIIVNTQWFSCTWHTDKPMDVVDSLIKLNEHVHVIGELNTVRYTSSRGDESVTEIKVTNVVV